MVMALCRGLKHLRLKAQNSKSGVLVSNFGFRISRWIAQGAVVGAALAATRPAFAQGCAMCYTTAAAAKKAGMRALQSGILILLVPPLLMFLGIFWFTFRSRRRFHDADFGSGEGGWDGRYPGLEPQLPSEPDEEPAEVHSSAA